MDSSLQVSQFSLNLRGHLHTYVEPVVMGILNLTPDSFYDGGHYSHLTSAIHRVETMIKEGADWIDVGAMSSRPYSAELPVNEEIQRLKAVLPDLCREFPNAIFSIDTYRSEAAEYALDQGISMINDITAGHKDASILKLPNIYKVPYIAMHMQGSPKDMQLAPDYDSILIEIAQFFDRQILQYKEAQIIDIIIDPGFGFGKTIQHNYTVLKNLSYFHEFGYPILVGLSRKSMIYKSLNILPQDALNGTSALHFEALRNGAKILRVHDVKEAKEVVKLYSIYKSV